MTEEKLLLRYCNDGRDPVSVKDYVSIGGYINLKDAAADPPSALKMITDSGLKGRSGSAFPAGIKWKTTADAKGEEKYIICNADEGEPGTAKDRLLLLEEPHSVIEGMILAGICTGARKGLIYIRDEYRQIGGAVEKAVEEAYRYGYLGEDPFGTGADFDIEVCYGAGSYLCGEETALLESLEGRRPETRQKPPYPGTCGLNNKPTVINNVETFACASAIVRYGADEFRRYGTGEYPGTKLMTVTGCVRRPGVYEVSVGATINELLELAGGATEELYAVQTGGGSGAIIPSNLFDIAFEPGSCARHGATFGTGSLMFIGESVSLSGLNRAILAFFDDESCGRCVPCRIGLKRLADGLAGLERGDAGCDPEELIRLANTVNMTARCALGTAAVTPFISSAENFPERLFGKGI